MRHRAWTPFYLVRYWRFLRLQLRHPDVVTEGFVFLGKRVEIEARRGYGRIVLGRWVHLGDDNRLRAHEGTLRIGDKTVFGRDNTLNCYLDVEFGPRCIVADWVYVCDFDHRFDDVDRPIKDQGIVKSPVRIGADVWVGVEGVGAARRAGRGGQRAGRAHGGARRDPARQRGGRSARPGRAQPADGRSALAPARPRSSRQSQRASTIGVTGGSTADSAVFDHAASRNQQMLSTAKTEMTIGRAPITAAGANAAVRMVRATSRFTSRTLRGRLR